MPSFLQPLPEIVSFVVATSLSSLALLPSVKEHHWARWVGVAVLFLLGVGACEVSRIQKRDADEQAKQEKQDSVAQEQSMQATINRLSAALAEDIRDKNAHPIILSNYEMLNEPSLGVPLGMQLKWVLRGSKDVTFINRQGWEIVPIDEDVTAIPNDERKKFEDEVWDRMMAEPTLSLKIPYTASTSGNALITTPLRQDQVDMLEIGHALAYFMEELRDPDTKQVVFSFCQFVDSRNSITACFAHNQT